jgi:peptidoglycan-N-acetylglucosamine deacetylase
MTWKPSFAVKASAILHVGAVAGLGVGLPWPLAIGGLVANHALLTMAGLWPRSALLGNNLRSLSSAAVRAAQIAITIDDGPHPDVTPVVLDILDRSSAQATFFCIGKAIQAHPALAREIIRRGHSIENHSYSHRHDFSILGPAGLTQEIALAQQIISETTGQSPLYFRAPAGLRSPLLDPVLQKLDLKLVSWTRRGFDTITTNPRKVQERLEHQLGAGDILLLHDGNAASAPSGVPIVLEVLPRLLETGRERGFSMVSLRDAA